MLRGTRALPATCTLCEKAYCHLGALLELPSLEHGQRHRGALHEPPDPSAARRAHSRPRRTASAVLVASSTSAQTPGQRAHSTHHPRRTACLGGPHTAQHATRLLHRSVTPRSILEWPAVHPRLAAVRIGLVWLLHLRVRFPHLVRCKRIRKNVQIHK